MLKNLNKRLRNLKNLKGWTKSPMSYDFQRISCTKYVVRTCNQKPVCLLHSGWDGERGRREVQEGSIYVYV